MKLSRSSVVLAVVGVLRSDLYGAKTGGGRASRAVSRETKAKTPRAVRKGPTHLAIIEGAMRGTTLPLMRLSRVFGHPDTQPERYFVVVAGLAQERLGIAVDELQGQQDIVVKSLGGRLQGVRGISGAADLANRRTVLVLDVGALLEEGMSTERRRA